MKHRFLAVLLALTMVLTLMPVGVAAEEVSAGGGILIIDGKVITGHKGTFTGELVIPNTVAEIGADALKGIGASRVVMPDSVTKIGDRAFSGCTSLTSVYISDKVTEIGVSAFSGSHLSDVVIPSSVQIIKDHAFASCTSLKGLIIQNGGSAQVTIEDCAFSGCTALESAYVSGAVTKIGEQAFIGTLDSLSHIHYGGSRSNLVSLSRNFIVLEEGRTNGSRMHYNADATWSGGTPSCGTNDPDAYEKNTIVCNADGCDSNQVVIQRALPRIAHTPETIKARPANCTEEGCKEDYQKCKICDEILSDVTVIPALGHKIEDIEGTIKVIKAATCETDGLESVERECSTCHDADTKETLERGIDATGHSYADMVDAPDNWEIVDYADCKTNTPGIQLLLRECHNTGCEHPEEDLKTNDSAHLTEDIAAIRAELAKPSTPSTPGTPTTREITVSGNTYTCTDGHTYKLLPAVHEAGEKFEIDKWIDGNCEDGGTASVYLLCKTCGERMGDAVEKELTAEEAPGHRYGEYEVVTEPTCDKEGSEKATCEVCGHEDFRPIEKLPHTYPEKSDRIKKDATCTENGIEIFICTKCGYEDEREIPLKGHTPTIPEKGTVLKEATCTDEGSIIYDTTCAVCKQDLQNTPVPIPALGHDFGPWTTSGGVRTRTCQREGCGYKETNSSTTPTEPSDPSNPSTPDSSRTYYSVDVIRPANGTISVSTSSARPGTTVTVTLRPNSGYQLDSVQVTRGGSGRTVSLSGSGNNRYTFTMPSSRVEVRAVFSTASGTSTNTTAPNSSTANPTKNIVINIPQISSASTPAGSRVFVDVPSTFWASGEIAWACQQGYAGGSGGNFYPNNPMTVRQVWAVMARMMGQNPSSMEEARLWAINNGFASGGNPNAAVTRLQLATMLYRLARLMGSNNVNTTNLGVYTDSRNIPQASRNAMAWAVANGIITGSSDGKLNPNTTVSRAQFCVILYRYYQRLF